MQQVHNLFGEAMSISARSGWSVRMLRLAVGGGEEDLRHLEMEPEVLLHCDGGFRRWSSSGELYDAEAEAGQERQRTMLT